MFNGYYAPDRILLVSVGRISPEKNFEFLLKILKRFPQAFLCIVGDGPYRERLEPLFPKNQTHFIGFLQGEQLAAAYASADYFIYASISETFGQVYLEAMSSGIPIVAAEGQQMKEFFINGIHGYTWKPEDVDSACKALNNAIRDRNILAQNCRSNALNHSWNSAANQIADVYETLSSNSSKTEAIANTQETSRPLCHLFSVVAKSVSILGRGTYYFSVWLFTMILALLFMAPFMKVSKPSKESLEKTESKKYSLNTTTDTALLNHCEQKKKKKNKKNKTKNRSKLNTFDENSMLFKSVSSKRNSSSSSTSSGISSSSTSSSKRSSTSSSRDLSRDSSISDKHANTNTFDCNLKNVTSSSTLLMNESKQTVNNNCDFWKLFMCIYTTSTNSILCKHANKNSLYSILTSLSAFFISILLLLMTVIYTIVNTTGLVATTSAAVAVTVGASSPSSSTNL